MDSLPQGIQRTHTHNTTTLYFTYLKIYIEDYSISVNKFLILKASTPSKETEATPTP